MSVKIKYKGTEIASASTEVTKTIKTAGKYCEADILVENTPDGGDAPVINPLSVTANGTYTAPSGVDGYSPVTVNVPQGVFPSGSVTLTAEDTYDVTDKASAVVDFSATRANLAEAVTAKGVDTLPTASFDTIATNIGLITGGGGGLPSSISKIDGGSFTLPTTKAPEDYWISHALGVVPKGYAIWAETRPPCSGTNAVSYGFVIINGDPGSGHVGYYFYNKLWQNQPSSENDLKGWITNAASYADTTRLRMWESTAPYEAGVTYKWLAWA